MRIWIISDLIDCIKWEINFWKNPTLHKLKMLSNETVEGDPLFSMQFWRIITWPIHVIWWIIVCIFFRPIRWIVNKSKGVKTKKDGSIDHRYIDEDEDEIKLKPSDKGIWFCRKMRLNKEN